MPHVAAGLCCKNSSRLKHYEKFFSSSGTRMKRLTLLTVFPTIPQGTVTRVGIPFVHAGTPILTPVDGAIFLLSSTAWNITRNYYY